MNSKVLKVCAKAIFLLLLLVVYAVLVGFFAYYLRKADGIGESLMVTGAFGLAYLAYILFNSCISSKILSHSTVKTINTSLILVGITIILSTLAFENQLFKGYFPLFKP